MRRCPECYEVYDNSEKFCEVDGQRLLADPARPDEERPVSDPDVNANREPWLTGLVGVMVGIFLCAGVYAIYSLWSLQSGPDVQQAPTAYSRTQEPVRPNPVAPARNPELNQETEAAPSPEAEASPETSPSPAPSPEAQDQVAVARLNQGPVSTGQAAKRDEEGQTVRTIIQMKDGTSVEVDAAWEDSRGIWYRRGAMVSFVESGRVKSITARAEPKAAPAPSQ